VHGVRRVGDTFFGAEQLIKRYGSAIVRRALSGITYYRELPVQDGYEDEEERRPRVSYQELRCWKASVISPAQLLNYLCREMGEEQLRERDEQQRQREAGR
jgi:hypothetical protein